MKKEKITIFCSFFLILILSISVFPLQVSACYNECPKGNGYYQYGLMGNAMPLSSFNNGTAWLEANGFSLNIATSGALQNRQTVNMWTSSGSAYQRWLFKRIGVNGTATGIVSAVDHAYGLNITTANGGSTSYNVTLHKTAGNERWANVFWRYWADANYIGLENFQYNGNHLLLRRAGDYKGAAVYWQIGITPKTSIWVCHLL